MTTTTKPAVGIGGLETANHGTLNSSLAGVGCDIQEIRKAIALLFVPGDTIEVRIPKCGCYGVVSGYFDDFDVLAKALQQADAKYRPPGVYYTINPADPALLARAYNRLKERAEVTTADNNIRRRRWLPIDLDPVRPAGVSFSDAEHVAAIARARLIADDMAAQWGRPILADSGNGAHLCYEIDLDNDDEALKFVSGALAELDRQYSDDVVRVDLTSSNAARIWKSYGTVSRKGDSIPARPHRLSRILEAPHDIA